jgi:hypothetical protein
MKAWVAVVLTGWSFPRWLRLALGLFVAYHAVRGQDGLAALVSGLLLFQAVTDTGCCGARGCSTPGRVKLKRGLVSRKHEETK